MTTTVGLGSIWLAQRIGEFLDLYPDVRVELILTNEELDLAMREADVAHPPAPPGAARPHPAPAVHGAFPRLRLEGLHQALRRAEDRSEDLDNHRLVSFGGDQPSYLLGRALARRPPGATPRDPRPYHCVVNNITALKIAVETGAGIGVLPDYAVDGDAELTQVLRDIEMPSLDSYLVYAEEMRTRRPRPGVPRFPRRQGAALDLLSRARRRRREPTARRRRHAEPAWPRPTCACRIPSMSHAALRKSPPPP